MKKFLLSVVLFCAIFLCLNTLPRVFLGPYYGNKTYQIKYEYFEEHKSEFNTLVFGSSRLYRHVDPQILDSSYRKSEMSTFNIAAPHTFNPEIYYLYEMMLDGIQYGEIGYAIVELQDLLPIGKSNVRTIRNYYWHNLQYLNYALRAIAASNRSLGAKTKLAGKYFLTYFYKLTNGLNYETLYDYIGSIDSLSNWLGDSKDGYYSLESHMKVLSGNSPIRQRRDEFLEDTLVVSERKSIAEQAFKERDHQRFVNAEHLKKLRKLIDKSDRNGVHLIFLIPPRLQRYNEVLALKEMLPRENVIEIADPSKYPKLYDVDYSFDIGHLNAKGAKLFSEYLAKELQAIQQL